MAMILILDDRATNRSIYARLASVIEDNVSVEVFGNPVDALEWLEGNRVDLVITDFKMPEMDGAEFTRHFRALPGGAGVPVLVVTAHDDRSFRVRALDAGATDFLQSPIDHFELVTRARNLLALGRRVQGEPVAAAEPPARPAALDPLQVHGAEGLARILDSLPAQVSAADRDGRCIYANAAFAAAVGARPSELLGAGPTLLFGPDRGERSRRADLEVLARGAPLPPYREEGAGGHLLTSKAPLRDARGTVTAVITTSIPLGPEPER
ncbi:response regulator [Paracraurococcus lichenis]|uniref:Response regulator n=1 Tax=Paracraurococcus lichenis TaxID=3064888 RepID=A0ABT9DXD3_9PROT|nr:response regulator [Paracraurococcus sp. LOR1-02]MDO9708551.1 response regulator [Paracraurococcus sp. LOR1-02]